MSAATELLYNGRMKCSTVVIRGLPFERRGAGVLYRMTTVSTQQSFEVSVMNKSCIERSELIARADESSRATQTES